MKATKEDKQNIKGAVQKLSSSSEKKDRANLSAHRFYEKNAARSLVGLLAIQGLIEYAEWLSLTFDKPNAFNPHTPDAARLENESYTTFRKSAEMLSTRIGMLSWL